MLMSGRPAYHGQPAIRATGALLVLVAMFAFRVCALTVNCDTQLVTIDASWAESGPVEFVSARIKGYEPAVAARGLRFAGGLTDTVANEFTVRDGNTCPIAGVTGTGSEVVYRGTWHGDGFNAYSHLYLADHGRFCLADAVLDFTNDSYFTRQLWVLGDGTGVLEVLPAFIADRTHGGTVAVGIGSYRLSNAILITHDTQGLPQHVRPDCRNLPTGYNGHLVFENEPGSRWIVAGTPQEYRGSVWIREHVTIETQEDLTHTGVKTIWSDYTLAGAFQTLDTGVTITKCGPAALVLGGEQAYMPGALLDITDGTVVFACDAAGGYLRPGDTQGGQELAVAVGDGAEASFTAPLVRVAALRLAPSARIAVTLGCTVSVAGEATVDATLRVETPAGFSAEPNTTFQLFAWEPSGTFTDIQLPSGPTWDISQLYSHGTITLTDGTVATRVCEPSSFALSPAGHATRLRLMRGRDAAGFQGMLLDGRVLSTTGRRHMPGGLHLFVEPDSRRTGRARR